MRMSNTRMELITIFICEILIKYNNTYSSSNIHKKYGRIHKVIEISEVTLQIHFHFSFQSI